MIFYPPTHPRSSFRFDPTGLLEILAFGALAFGGVEAISAMKDQPKAPTPPPAPNATTAKDTAQVDINNQRRLALLTGGLTDYTGGNATFGSGDINKTALLGN